MNLVGICTERKEGKMENFLLKLSFIIWGLVSLTILSCAPPVVKTTALVPARFHEAAKLKVVAVLPFDGPGGRELANEIEGTLASVNIDDKQYFILIDRTKLEKILKEQEFSQTGMVDETTAVKVGKLIGAKGIYTGAVTVRNCKDSHFTEERSECAQRQIEYDKKGRAREGKCIGWRKYSVPCTKRDAIFSFTPKLIEVETSRIIYSNNVSGVASASECRDSGRPLPSEIDIIARAMESAKMTFKKDVAPNYVTFSIKLMESKEGITSKEAERIMDQGMEFAKHNRLDRACELWGEARILTTDSPSLLYNLGICAEVRGDLENALDLYKKADRALNKPDDRITAAMGRVSEAIKKRQVLQEQLKVL